jgi:hypothetical protein
MNGFLGRWVEREANAPAQGGGSDGLNALPIVEAAPASDASGRVPEILPEETSPRATSWAEWKADELNKLFQEQGVTRQRSRLTADTVQRGQSRNERDERAESNSASEFTSVRVCDDSKAADAILKTGGLLAAAYRRSKGAQHVGATRRRESGDDELANSAPPSVHGVVP